MSVKEYLAALEPVNILELLDGETLQHLLNGYAFRLNSGIALVFPLARPARLDALDRLDALGTDKQRTFHPLCQRWRSLEGCGGNQACLDADKREAMKYFRGEATAPRLYRCEPLSLWDMTYPLTAGGQPVAVLFAGQVAVSGDISWRQALAGPSDQVDWATCPERDNHLDAVRNRIEAKPIPEATKRQLIEVLAQEMGRGRMVIGTDELERRFNDFLSFGKMTQGLLDSLYTRRTALAEQRLGRYFDDALDRVDLTGRREWVEGCERVLRELTELPEVEALRLYARDRSRYVCAISPGEPSGPRPNLLARDVVPACAPNRLVSLSGVADPAFLGNLGLGLERVWGYRSQTGAGREQCSTLVAFRGNVPDAKQGLLADLCAQACTAADFAQLLFRERTQDEEYRKQVRQIGHSFRTPLQALQFLLEDVQREAKPALLRELLAAIEEGMARIREARADVALLLEPAEQREEVFNLVEVLEHVIVSLQPLADRHPCALRRYGTPWPGNVPVRGVRHRVQRALTNLLDNAIKYSYRGSWRRGRGLHEVRISLAFSDSLARVTMVNYGIGIPEDRLAAIREYGVRGEVPDDRKPRLGTGLGLPFAIDVFEELKGWINVTSVPAPSATEEERRTYHRYITTVEAVLPLA